jgi:RNA polymerase sigma-70 factor (ECF subfamily)
LKEDKDIGEEELANLCSKGDNMARRELYTKYAAWLTMICSRYADSSVEAKDLMHDSMVEVFRSIKNFEYRGKGSLRAWIRSIAVNTAIDKKRKYFLNKTMNLQDIQNDIADVYPEDADKVPLSVLKTMISELPETKKVIFCLYCIDGFSHRQISDRLGITENASSSMLSKAKRMLASKIKAYLKKEENHR